jgi:hypothetical protein
MRVFKELKFGDFAGFDELATELGRILPITKIIYLSGVKTDDMRAFYNKLAESIGEVVEVDEDANTGDVTGNKWVDIRYDPNKANFYRYSSSFQPLHNDAAYVSNPPEIAFFYCEKQASRGGSSIFLDGNSLIYHASIDCPELLEKLETFPLTFEKGERSRTKTIVSYDDKGPLLNWIRTRAKNSSECLFVDEFADYLWKLYFKWDITSVSLKPGESVFFHDERVFHGRESFVANKESDRLLWKGGIRIRKQKHEPLPYACGICTTGYDDRDRAHRCERYCSDGNYED